MKRPSSPTPTLYQAVSHSACFCLSYIIQTLGAFFLMAKNRMVKTMQFTFLAYMIDATSSQPMEKKPNMRHANTFTTNSDLQIIFIQGSKKVLIECSEHFVERYQLKEYVYVMSYEDFKIHVHEDDVSLFHFYACTTKQQEDTRFRLRLPDQNQYVTFFHRGYYDLDGGIGFLAFDISHVEYLREQLKQKELEYLLVVEETRRVSNHGRDLVVKLSLEGTILSVSPRSTGRF